MFNIVNHNDVPHNITIPYLPSLEEIQRLSHDRENPYMVLYNFDGNTEGYNNSSDTATIDSIRGAVDRANDDQYLESEF